MDLLNLVKYAYKLDACGKYKEADQVFFKIAYYPNQSLKNVNDFSYWEWDELVDKQFEENDTNYITKKPNLRPKEYLDQGDGTDPNRPEELNTEARLNGPSGVTGPAGIYPINPASSPSMAGDLNYFSWEEAYENNPNTRIPRR